jgi:hypothetical protein
MALWVLPLQPSRLQIPTFTRVMLYPGGLKKSSAPKLGHHETAVPLTEASNLPVAA